MPCKVSLLQDGRAHQMLNCTAVIKLVTAVIYTNYRTTIVEAHGVGEAAGSVGGPTNSKLELEFHPWTRDDDCPPITPITPMR